MDIRAFASKILGASNDAKMTVKRLGGMLNDVYLIRVLVDSEERNVVAKDFRDWSNFKWFPLTLWSIGTRTFTVLGRSRLEKEIAINQLLHSKGFAVPKILCASPNQRLVFMEYIDGEHLSKVAKRISTLKDSNKLKEDLAIIEKVGRLVAKVHVLGVSLGDSKPENMLIAKNGEIYLMDFEQASRNGDKVWDIAEFLYYSGHFFAPLAEPLRAELLAESFINGYSAEGGNVENVKKAGDSKYTKVFSIFTLPRIILTISNYCRKTELNG
jgi:tRNA A-37 threonylcarbamoyl transferase component Bud32